MNDEVSCFGAGAPRRSTHNPPLPTPRSPPCPPSVHRGKRYQKLLSDKAVTGGLEHYEPFLSRSINFP